MNKLKYKKIKLVLKKLKIKKKKTKNLKFKNIWLANFIHQKNTYISKLLITIQIVILIISI